MKWQPIETAPKDGSYLLLRLDPSENWLRTYCFVGCWDDKHWRDCVDAVDFKVTHWQSLPEDVDATI